VVFLFTFSASVDFFSLSLHDALPILIPFLFGVALAAFQLVLVLYIMKDQIELPESITGETILIYFLIVSTILFFMVRSSQYLFRSEEHTSELQSRENLVCRLLLDKIK